MDNVGQKLFRFAEWSSRLAIFGRLKALGLDDGLLGDCSSVVIQVWITKDSVAF